MNVTHESVAGTTRDKEHTVWKTHLRAAGGGGDGEKWFQIQDLIVEETRKEMIFLGETTLQVSSVLCCEGIAVVDRHSDLGTESRFFKCKFQTKWQCYGRGWTLKSGVATRGNERDTLMPR